MSKFSVVKVSTSSDEMTPEYAIVEVSCFLSLVTQYLPIIRTNNLFGVIIKDSILPDFWLITQGTIEGLKPEFSIVVPDAYSSKQDAYFNLDDISDLWAQQDTVIEASEDTVNVLVKFTHYYNPDEVWFRVEFDANTLEPKSYLTLVDELPNK